MFHARNLTNLHVHACSITKRDLQRQQSLLNFILTREKHLSYLQGEMKKATQALIEFRDERDWKQFHDPKNLAAALGIEAAELNEVFLWKTTDASSSVDINKVKEELADVFAYALLMADAFNLDPEAIVLEKVKANAVKYPVEKAKGTATKYTDL